MTRAVFLVACLLLSGPSLAEPIVPGAVRVVDGDTVDYGGARYRLVGFDTPETASRAHCSAERNLGNRAASRLRQLIAGGGVDIRRVPCSCHPGTEGTDACNHGRLCAVLTTAGKDVGAVLIAEGLARPYVCAKTNCRDAGRAAKPWC